MYRSFQSVFFVSVILFFCTCKTPYTPTPISTVTNYLVVEGLINITDSTYINLSRTVNLSAKTTAKPELKATVTVESNAGGSYPLKELGNGVYAAGPLNLSAANQYHLRIKTSNNSSYVSDFVPAKVSPPIDTITWAAKSNALEIYANTHDPKNATRYYRWDFTEGWEFHSFYNSQIISNGLQVSFRTPAQQIWDCFGSDASTNISLGTSVQFSNDVISQQLINTIDATAEKIGIKYSILVKQYALTKDAYDYWALLKKNTEQLGSIFDSQPSTSLGNVHGVTNPAEVVIGYISAGTVTTSRIFITKKQLPNWVTTPAYGLSVCSPPDSLNCCPPPIAPPGWVPPSTDHYVNYKSATYFGINPPLIPIEEIGSAGTLTNTTPISAFIPVCVDCTLRGKSTPPPYWK